MLGAPVRILIVATVAVLIGRMSVMLEAHASTGHASSGTYVRAVRTFDVNPQDFQCQPASYYDSEYCVVDSKLAPVAPAAIDAIVDQGGGIWVPASSFITSSAPGSNAVEPRPDIVPLWRQGRIELLVLQHGDFIQTGGRVRYEAIYKQR